MTEQKFELDEAIFKEAIFETIRLWCVKEFDFSNGFKDAFKNYVDNKSNKGVQEIVINEYSDKYLNFLNYYSIARTRKKKVDVHIIKKLFDKIEKEKEVFNPEMIENLASELKASKCTEGRALSLVAKSIFLNFPDTAVIFDKNAKDSLKVILNQEYCNKRNCKKCDIKCHKPIIEEVSNSKKKEITPKYHYYYYSFEKLINIVKKNEYKWDLVVEEFINNKGEIIKNYYELQFEILKLKYNFNNNDLAIIFDRDFLFRRSLDKFLWLYYEKYLKKENNNKVKNNSEDE